MPKGPNLETPILPGVGLGGLQLGQPYSMWKRWVEESWSDGEGIEHALLAEGRIQVVADVSSDRIIGVLALAGYQGKLLDAVHPGMTFGQALEHLPLLLFNDFEASLYEPQRLDFVLKHESFEVSYPEMLQDPIYSIDVRDWEHEYWWHFRPLISDCEE